MLYGAMPRKSEANSAQKGWRQADLLGGLVCNSKRSHQKDFLVGGWDWEENEGGMFCFLCCIL